MKNAVVNRGVIRKIAHALGELNGQVIYVGGATVGLYVNDPAADDVRPTKDLDISLSIASLVELEQIRLHLCNRGFIQAAEDTVTCRFRYEDIRVDVMNTTSIGWAPANPWFFPGYQRKEKVEVDGSGVFILPLSYFLASKFTAYKDRGSNEPRSSHDFEDIVYVLDNRIDIVENHFQSPDDVKRFLQVEYESMLINQAKQEAIYANLYHETREDRFQMINHKLRQMIS